MNLQPTKRLVVKSAVKAGTEPLIANNHSGKRLVVKSAVKAGTPPEQYAKLGVRKLSDPEWQKSKTDAQIHEVIEKGSKGTAMRAFKELKPAEIDALVKFVRTLNGAPAK